MESSVYINSNRHSLQNLHLGKLEAKSKIESWGYWNKKQMFYADKAAQGEVNMEDLRGSRLDPHGNNSLSHL